MPKRKIVIDEKEGSVLVGVMKEGADPVMKTVEGTLDQALAGIPQLLQEAETKWAGSLRNPAYKAPVETKPKTTKPAGKAEEVKPTEELPLLKDKGTGKPTTTAVAAPAEKVEPSVAAPAAPAEAGVTPPPETVTPPSVGAGVATHLPYEYYLKDGRGPFNTVQEAMDAMGLDKKTRPAHNRWDRLSTSLKEQIQRREKKS